MSTDEDWQILGEQDPYFGVLTDEQFRRDRMTTEALDAFFRTGREEAAALIADCRKHLGEVSTRRTLEFGCGVGRLLIPFAELSESSVGIDISDAMRAEAASNCSRFNCRNVKLVRSLDDLDASETFTFIYSYIVLQHIDTRRGLDVVDALLNHLAKHGCAALHVTYGHVKYEQTLGVAPWHRRSILRRIRQPLSQWLRRLRGREPKMQMNAYSLNKLFFLVQRHGIRSGGFRYTDHHGHLGLILFLKRE